MDNNKAIAALAMGTALASSSPAFTLDLSGIDPNPSRTNGPAYASATIEYLPIGSDGHNEAVQMLRDLNPNLPQVFLGGPLPGVLSMTYFDISEWSSPLVPPGLTLYALDLGFLGDQQFQSVFAGQNEDVDTGMSDRGWLVNQRVGLTYQGGSLEEALTMGGSGGYWFVPVSTQASLGLAYFPSLYPLPHDYVHTGYFLFGRSEIIDTSPDGPVWGVTLYDGFQATLRWHTELSSVPVPEPTTMALGAGALAAAAARRRRRRG